MIGHEGVVVCERPAMNKLQGYCITINYSGKMRKSERKEEKEQKGERRKRRKGERKKEQYFYHKLWKYVMTLIRLSVLFWIGQL